MIKRNSKNLKKLLCNYHNNTRSVIIPVSVLNVRICINKLHCQANLRSRLRDRTKPISHIMLTAAGRKKNPAKLGGGVQTSVKVYLNCGGVTKAV